MNLVLLSLSGLPSFLMYFGLGLVLLGSFARMMAAPARS